MFKAPTWIACALACVTTGFAGYDEDFEAAKKLGVAGKRAEALAAFKKLADTTWLQPIVGLLAFFGTVISASAATNAVSWFEAEAYESQRGSTAPKYTLPSASGGACMDNGWGGQLGHFLRYQLELAADSSVLHVTVRYAREMPGDATVSVSLDGDTNTARLLKLPSTGDWGFKPEGWKYASVQLPTTAKGPHTLEIRSQADRNNVNFDGFYLSDGPVDTNPGGVPPAGPEAIAPLGEGLFPLPCRTPIAVPYSRRKAFVAGHGLLQSLLSSPEPRGCGQNVAGPSWQVLLAGHGPWHSVEQTLVNSPVPTVLTRWKWPEADVEQAVFAAAPEEQGFFVRVSLTNKSSAARNFELVSRVLNAAPGSTPLRVLPAPGIHVAADRSDLPGPLGSGLQWRHTVPVATRSSVSFDLHFLGDGLSRDAAYAGAAKVWQQQLAAATPTRLPEPKLQFAYDAALRQLLMLVEARPDHARILKGLQHYYGANPYDTFQASRALDAAGLKADAEELLRHQIQHLKHDGIFEMWETGDLQTLGAQQWIVQGLAVVALWEHYRTWRDEAWLKEIAPAVIQSAQATLRARQEHAGNHRQGTLDIAGWLPPLGGDGGLGVGYHWSQNAGPLAGVRTAAEVARKLNRPEAEELQAGWRDFQHDFDRVRIQTAQRDPDGILPSFPGATDAQRFRPLWGVVMSVSAFEAIPHDDPAAVKTLRFLQENQYGGLHLNLGYSRGVWPYLSAEVALWHLRLGETEEAWRILRAMVDRASSTVCWYEEIDHDPPRGHGDPADVWAAAELVYLARQLVALPVAKAVPRD